MGELIQNYGQLMDELLGGSIHPVQFQRFYLERFKREAFMEEPLFQILDALFGVVDAYCADAEIRKTLSETAINDSELYAEVRKARDRLTELESRDSQ
ncbi:colicin immunity domain-containing protein [Dyella silvae]|uniref:colicin immunity domain-containing protein n=1 Tax=Dyella silvae TaxID=2994424 RepID=UPI0022651844|nr:colicin immunity domain-containing protein [Dyella silvae]